MPSCQAVWESDLQAQSKSVQSEQSKKFALLTPFGAPSKGSMRTGNGWSHVETSSRMVNGIDDIALGVPATPAWLSEDPASGNSPCWIERASNTVPSIGPIDC